MLQQLLNKTDILDKAMTEKVHVPREYSSYVDGENFKENTFTDKTDQPQTIGKGFSTKGTIGGNGHKNWSVIRLLPPFVDHCVPEGNNYWEILRLLKDIVELVVAPKHTDARWQSTESCCSQLFQISYCDQNITMWNIILT